MSHFNRLVYKLAPERIRLAWGRRALQTGYGRDIAAAKKAKDMDRVAGLEASERFEMDLHEELEDSYLTSSLLRQARRLRVPIPYVRNPGGTESNLWYEGQQTGGWYLSSSGIRHLRQEIRQELKARHESRTHYIVWLTALTGVIGSVTGLIAVLQANG